MKYFVAAFAAFVLASAFVATPASARKNDRPDSGYDATGTHSANLHGNAGTPAAPVKVKKPNK